ncbi:hypothetical protein [Reichenbachiella agariperforans]|uniref:hypothetical protein n=1 Tax=Reichenbachiella agariperforans TaxID=156994 RepID=UPI001C09A9A9|nr:hypothetical protein [Reichenbachiella agariperforans]MBU2914849.1 hypothetical protein [Reichenbachiella agariperforans]
MDQTVHELGHSIRYQDIYGIANFEKYARSNHLNGSCKDSLITTIFKAIDLIATATDELVMKTGGIDVNGKYLAACDMEIGGKILNDMNFYQRLNQILDKADSFKSTSEYHQQMAIRLKDDVRILRSEYDQNNIATRKLLEILFTLNNARMKLLFSETIMFEMLKSNGMC